MMTTVQALVWSGILTFLMLVLGLLLRTQAWSPSGLMVAFSDREGVVAPLGMAGRADRAANNMIEAMAMFLALVLAASIAGKAPQVAFGATRFSTDSSRSSRYSSTGSAFLMPITNCT